MSCQITTEAELTVLAEELNLHGSKKDIMTHLETWDALEQSYNKIYHRNRRFLLHLLAYHGRFRNEYWFLDISIYSKIKLYSRS